MIKAYFQEDGGRTIVFLNPHSDAVLHVERLAADEFDFFGFVLNGHKYLWLPPNRGPLCRRLWHTGLCHRACHGRGVPLA